MRLFSLTIFAAGLVLAAVGTATADDLAPELVGSWKLTKAERDGKSLAKEEIDGVTVTCSKADGGGIKCVVKKGDEVVAEGTIKHAKSDEKVKGDHYDMTYTKGTGKDKDGKDKDLKGTTVHGLVHVHGDTLMVCWGEKHPKDFTAAEGSHQTCRTYERIKK